LDGDPQQEGPLLGSDALRVCSAKRLPKIHLVHSKKTPKNMPKNSGLLSTAVPMSGWRLAVTQGWATKDKSRMEHDFRLIVSGFDDLTHELEAVAGNIPDCTGLGLCAGVPEMSFSIEADSFRDAVLSAIQQVESLGLGIKVERLEPDELVGLSDIGRRVGLTRETIRLYANGSLGPGGFPHPVATPSKNARVWKWLDVVNWFTAHGIADVDQKMALHATTVATINAALELRKHIGTKKALNDLWKELPAL
jgi:hypothetical protein